MDWIDEARARETRGKIQRALSWSREPDLIVAVILLPTGAKEVITNSQNVRSKLEYYLDTYDELMRLKHNTNIQMLDVIVR